MSAIDQTHYVPVPQVHGAGLRRIGRVAGLLTAAVLVFASLYYMVLYVASG